MHAKTTILLAAAALLLGAAPAGAQATISPGMTPAQVRETFGTPAQVRESGVWEYWYYLNGCPRSCGSDDVVFFRDGRVVAAVLRTASRRFAGPPPDRALEAAGGQQQQEGGAAVAGEPLRVGGIRVQSAAPEPQRGQVIIVPSRDAEATPRAQGSSSGEPSTIVIQGNVEQQVPTQPRAQEADESEGDTVERALEDNVKDKANEETATERARRHDRPRPPN